MSKLLYIQDVSVIISGQVILSKVNLEVNQGEIVTIIGPNGSGKTSLAKLVLGIYQANEGSVEYKKGLKLGYMPQKITLNKHLPLSVMDFLQVYAKNKQNLDDMIKLTGIENLLPMNIHKLSGGQLQRVLLTSAILNSPDLLVLDEPVGGLDINGQAEFYDLIELLRKKFGTAILMISHDLYMVMKKTDKVICLNQHVCCHGTPEDVHNNAVFNQLFGAGRLENMTLYSHKHDHKH